MYIDYITTMNKSTFFGLSGTIINFETQQSKNEKIKVSS